MLRQVKWYTSCAIGGSSDKEGSPETWTAQANENHYGVSKYSCVAVRGNEYGKDVTWYAQLQAFFSFNVSARGIECKVAFVKYFKVIGTDDITKCPKLQWEAASKRWGLIDIETILRVVHVVELFNEGGSSSTENYLLNKYLWRDQALYED